GSPRRVTPSGHVTSSYGLRSMAGDRRASASSTSIGSLRIACVPTMTSVTPGARLRIVSPSCCATQPATATIGSWPISCAICRSSPSRVYNFSSARSRTLHVLMTTTSASAAASVASNPACSSSPAMRSESWTFIWQPKVSMRYLGATVASLCVLCPLCVLDAPDTFRFRSFAFAFRLRFARSGPGRSRRRPVHQHLMRRPPNAIGDCLSAEHSCKLVDARAVAETRDRGARPPAVDPLPDFKVRVGVRGNLRQMRDAEHLKRRPEGAKLAPDDVGDAPADAGVDFVEDQTGRRRARPTVGGVAETVARRGDERLDREHDARQ